MNIHFFEWEAIIEPLILFLESFDICHSIDSELHKSAKFGVV